MNTLTFVSPKKTIRIVRGNKTPPASRLECTISRFGPRFKLHHKHGVSVSPGRTKTGRHGLVGGMADQDRWRGSAWQINEIYNGWQISESDFAGLKSFIPLAVCVSTAKNNSHYLLITLTFYQRRGRWGAGGMVGMGCRR